MPKGKVKGYKYTKKGNNETFRPFLANKELNTYLDTYCMITNQTKSSYCEKVLLEQVTKDIENLRKLIKEKKR